MHERASKEDAASFQEVIACPGCGWPLRVAAYVKHGGALRTVVRSCDVCGYSGRNEQAVAEP